MAEEWKLEGKTFLITGGASGLGAAYAENFLKHGAQNVAILDIAEKVGTEFVEKLNETYNDKAIFVKCDVSKEEEIKNSFDEVVNAFKRIDVIINNAGVMNDAPNVWRVASEINWQGTASMTMKGLDHMRTDQGGSGGTIINISSGAGIAKFSIVPMYCGSKAAILQFGRSLAIPAFYAMTGVRLLTLVLGATKTALIDDIKSKTFDEVITTPMLPYLQLAEQNIDSAVAAVTKMFEQGTPGSIWLSICNRPGQDITATIDAAYEEIEKLLMPEGIESLYDQK
ncbi:15-hydroxyprostaglandin dehydrogenase [NAD(+)]-like [Maniola hyperantus]|uniref:15-hydroxyprostaglandin dehydrogenase [NAD(+)]-like n=1 Tax=Aphantopus hyperantus TaxID=2795564 RepID=UPI0015691FDD|nr:15-hydroxyprostaglandin dehydrogenase [NAD(+)]-like [Maniola hyperantus]